MNISKIVHLIFFIIKHYIYPKNQAVIGKQKDEYHSKIITEFIGVRSKLYSITAGGEKDKKVAKGVKRCVIKNN